MIYKHEVKTEILNGYVEVELLPWRERIQKTREVSYKLVDGKLVEKEDFEQGEEIISLAVDRVRSVNITSGDKIITSVDELMNYTQGVSIINEISRYVFNGVSLEKK